MKRNTLLLRLLLISVLALVVVACSSEEEAEDLEQPPAFYLVRDGDRLGPYQGTFCWMEEEGDSFDFDEVGGIGEVCEDESVPDFSASDFVVIPAGEPLAIAMEEPLPDRLTLSLSSPDDVFLEQSTTEIAIEDSLVTWEPENVEPGDYNFIALGFWRDAGGGAYYFPVTLE